MDRKRVGYVVASISRKAGGVSTSASGLAMAVEIEERYESSVFGLLDEYSESDKEKWPRGREIVLTGIVGPSSFGYSPSLQRELSRAKLDIIHNHGVWMYPSVAVLKAANASSIPYIVSPHGMLSNWALKVSRKKKMIANVLYERRHLERAHCLHALCEAEAEDLRSLGLRNPICIVPNGVSLPTQSVWGRPALFSNISPNKKILLYLGRIHPKKGLRELIEAWVPFRDKDWHLVIVGWGRGEYQSALLELARELHCLDSITFAAPQFDEDKMACYQWADAFVLPSYSEGVPMAVLEAWSCGLPVLMTPECNLKRGFDVGAAICIHNEPTRMREGLGLLFSMSNGELADMGSKGLSLVESEYSWNSIGRKMVAVYDWILKRGSMPSSVELL